MLMILGAAACSSSRSATSGGSDALNQARAAVAAIDRMSLTGDNIPYQDGYQTGQVALLSDGFTVRKATHRSSPDGNQRSDTYYFDASGQLIGSKAVSIVPNCNNRNETCAKEIIAYFQNGATVGVEERMVSAPVTQERSLLTMLDGAAYTKSTATVYASSETSAYQTAKDRIQGTAATTPPETHAGMHDAMIAWMGDQVVRDESNPDAPVKLTLKEGDMVFPTGERSSSAFTEVIKGRRYTGHYLKVRTQNGMSGWMHENSLKPPVHYTVVANVASLREEPTNRSTAIGQLKEGTKVMFYGNKAGNPVDLTIGGKTVTDNFYRVRTMDGKIGWLHGATIVPMHH